MADAYLRKLLILVIKITPCFLSIVYIIYTILAMIGIRCWPISIIAGSSLISATILLLNSLVFRFCFYHRIFIYYVYIINVLNIIDWYFLIAISSKWLIAVSLILFLICAFVALYLYMKEHEIRIVKTRT